VLGPHRRPVEEEKPAALEHAVYDGLRQVLIMKDVTPGAEGFVGGEGHRSLLEMADVDHVEEHVGGRPCRR
jgi:hypothetical protein